MPLTKGIEWRSALDTLFKKVDKLKRGHRMLIFAGTLLLLGGGFFFFVYMPSSEEINRIEKEIEGLKQRIALTKAKAKNVAKFRDERARVEKQFKETLKILPDKREIPSLLAGISQLGIDSKLQFRLFSPGKEELQDFYVKIPVSIEVGGRYRDVALFFDKVRRMDRIVNIVRISMKPKAPLSTELITKCTAITYRFKTKADELIELKDKKKKK